MKLYKHAFTLTGKVPPKEHLGARKVYAQGSLYKFIIRCMASPEPLWNMVLHVYYKQVL